MKRHPRLASALFALLAPTIAGQEAAPLDALLPTAERAWIVRAVATWDGVRREALGIEVAGLPWMIFFDATHVWHVNGAADAESLAPAERVDRSKLELLGDELPVVGWPHGGELRLPAGEPAPIALMTFAARVEPDGRPYLVCALPSIWRRDVQGLAPERLEALTLAVFAHEMSHTRQARSVGSRISALADEHDLGDDFDDDVVQDRFGHEPGFREIYREERDLFYRAAAEEDPELCRQYAEEAVRLTRERRAGFLDGEHAFYAELEDLFLAMEGSANWVGYQVLLRAGLSAEDAADLIRGGRDSWTQDEGLAIFLVLDRLLPDWKERVFAPEAATLAGLLDEAVAGG